LRESGDILTESVHYLRESERYLTESVHYLRESERYLTESAQYLRESERYLTESVRYLRESEWIFGGKKWIFDFGIRFYGNLGGGWGLSEPGLNGLKDYADFVSL
jgi:hypothetical protein